MTKQVVYLFILFVGISFGVAEDLYADHLYPKRKQQSKTSCTVSRGKFTSSDLVEYNYGVRFGQNIATIKSRKGDSQDVVTGWMGGLVLQMIWPNGFVVQPEILYSRKGCMFTGSNLQYDMDYVEIPVNFMYRIHMAEVKPFAIISPYGAYAFRLTEVGDITSDDTYSSQINKWDYGIGVGAGFDIWKIQLSFKYNWGFAKVLEDELTVRNKVFTISAAFLF